MLCYVMLCYVMLCYVMLCYVMTIFDDRSVTESTIGLSFEIIIFSSKADTVVLKNTLFTY
jgi:hypothetical protein